MHVHVQVYLGLFFNSNFWNYWTVSTESERQVSWRQQDSTSCVKIGDWLEERSFFYRKVVNYSLLDFGEPNWERKTLEVMEMITEWQGFCVFFVFFSVFFSFLLYVGRKKGVQGRIQNTFIPMVINVQYQWDMKGY